MKKLWIALICAMLALAFVAVPAFAYCPPQDGASAEVVCDEPGVDDDSPMVGQTVLFYGTVHVDASAYNNKDYADDWYYCWYYQTGAYSYASGDAYYVIYAPDGFTVVDSGSDSWSSFDEGDTGYWGYMPWDENTSACVDEDWYWDSPVFIDTAGDYTVENGGTAYAEYGNWIQYGHYEFHWYGWTPVKVWVPDSPVYYYEEDDPAYDECFAKRTVTAHANAPLSTGRTRPILTIELTGDSGVFFPSDGWGNPTTDGIVFTDGVWQVEITDGTKIMLDGEWRRKTWIEVDDQGNVTGKYGYDGHITAEEIGLSSPIKVTKVG
jgi:hypothetical protein